MSALAIRSSSVSSPNYDHRAGLTRGRASRLARRQRQVLTAALGSHPGPHEKGFQTLRDSSLWPDGPKFASAGSDTPALAAANRAGMTPLRRYRMRTGDRLQIALPPHQNRHDHDPQGQKRQSDQRGNRGNEALVAHAHAADDVRDPGDHRQPAGPAGVDVADRQRDPVEDECQTDQREGETVDPDLDPADRLGSAKRPPPAGQALAQASTARFSATPSTAWRMVNEAPVVIAAARPKRVTAAAASGLIGIEK
jgi:hypothetical protein